MDLIGPCSLMNANHRKHFRVAARFTSAWRHAAKGQALAHGLGPVPVPCHITVVIHRSHNRGEYDAGNYAPTAKAVVDGLVDAGVLPDDRNRYVIGPDMRPGEPWRQAGVTVILTPAYTHRHGVAYVPPTYAPAGDPLWT